MKKALWLVGPMFVWTAAAQAKPAIRFLDSAGAFPEASRTKIEQVINDELAKKDQREIRAQLINNADGEPDHVLVYLHSKAYHRVQFASIALDAHLKPSTVTHNYQLQAEDRRQQPGGEATAARCPDPTVEFIAFAPNNDDLELDITKEVAAAAKAKNLKTVELYVRDATRAKYLAYMSCPKLRGNFYDGDADPSSIVTYDGIVSSDDISTVLNASFRHAVTNIWLACEAYNDPILGSVVDDAQTRKYAAGINDLLVGPSDRAAACAMEAAIDGKPMQASFKACYDKLDNKEDQWGWGGNGTDNFWD